MYSDIDSSIFLDHEPPQENTLAVLNDLDTSGNPNTLDSYSLAEVIAHFGQSIDSFTRDPFSGDVWDFHSFPTKMTRIHKRLMNCPATIENDFEQVVRFPQGFSIVFFHVGEHLFNVTFV